MGGGPNACRATFPKPVSERSQVVRYMDMMEVDKIITHSGIFHADEVFACALARLYWGLNVPIVRTRDTAAIETAKTDPRILLLDVGESYDPHLLNFDHHGRPKQNRPQAAHKWTIPYATFGLLWSHCADIVALDVWKEIDDGLVAAVDAADHGIRCVGPNFGISSVISQLNPNWINSAPPDAFNQAFVMALEMAIRVLKNNMNAVTASLDAASMISAALADKDRHPGLVVLDRYMPLKNFDWHKKPTIFYAIYPNLQQTGWCIRCIEDKRGPRLLLPETWRGLHGPALVIASGCAEAEYTDNSGRLMEVKTKASAVHIARSIVQLQLRDEKPATPKEELVST